MKLNFLHLNSIIISNSLNKKCEKSFKNKTKQYFTNFDLISSNKITLQSSSNIQAACAGD